MSNPRLAFVTIGQTPRNDIVPEMLDEIAMGHDKSGLDIVEFGALDGLSSSALEQMRARPDEHSFATRLADGREVVLSRDRTQERLNALLYRVDQQGFTLIVVLCTGARVDPLRRTLLVESQIIVDATVQALSYGIGCLGVVLPLERQIVEFEGRHLFAREKKLVSASPYADCDLATVGARLTGCDLAVMHCMGYTAAMRAQLRRSVKAPVLLSRHIVASAVRHILW